MRLGSVRDAIGIQPVLRNRDASGPDPVYFMFNHISLGSKWANMTVIAPGSFDGEFPKTFGHYHGVEVDETYEVISGKGIFLLQKKAFDKKMWLMETTSEVLAVHGETGDRITIPWEWGHSWSNIGGEPLILYDNWTAGHDPSDYAVIEKLQGMAYYLINKDGKVVFEPNNHYQNLPPVREVTAKEFGELKKK